ncbi:MAG: glutathione peroxidase [Bacteroidota bacterium]
MASIYNSDIRVEGIDGTPINLDAFKGKKLLIVNVASECGFTPQYAQLQDLYSEFQDKLTVLGCPSNDFGGQEPSSEAAIQEFCSLNFGVTFPMTAKVSILKDPITPLYQWLTTKALNEHSDSTVAWNFQKYLLDEVGLLIAMFPSTVEPASDDVLDHFL